MHETSKHLTAALIFQNTPVCNWHKAKAKCCNVFYLLSQ